MHSIAVINKACALETAFKEVGAKVRKLYECESAMHYATLMTFGHYEKPRDVEQIMCGEFANLSNGDWGR